MTPQEFLTVAAVARLLQCSDETVRRRILAGLLVPDAVVRTTHASQPVFRPDFAERMVVVFGRAPRDSAL